MFQVNLTALCVLPFPCDLNRLRLERVTISAVIYELRGVRETKSAEHRKCDGRSCVSLFLLRLADRVVELIV